MNKLFILTILAFQTAAHILAVRYTRSNSGPLYLSSSVVTSCELLKLIVSLLAILYQCKLRLGVFKNEIVGCFSDWTDFARLLVPGLLYTFQNNLLYIALSNLPAATYQVLYQMKLLNTALFSYFMLGRKLSLVQCMALFVLFVGVVLVELDGAEEKSNSTTKEQRPLVGLIAVVVASLSSGFAGVYFERLIKGSSGSPSSSKSTKPAQQSIWCKNVQLAIIGVTLGLMTGLYKDYDVIVTKGGGFFYGFNNWVWLVVLLQGVGGIIVSMVVKHADNILKGFACAAAILLACIGSYFLFDFQINLQFLMGTVCVVFAIFLYSLPSSTSSSADKPKKA